MTNVRNAAVPVIDQLDAWAKQLLPMLYTYEQLKTEYQAAQAALRARRMEAEAAVRDQFQTEEQELRDRYEPPLTEMPVKIAALKRKLRRLSRAQWAVLAKPGKASFTTSTAIFGTRLQNKGFEITSSTGVLKEARQVGMMKKVCKIKIKVTYTPDAEMLEKFLESRPDLKNRFAPHVRFPYTYRSRTIKANMANPVYHGKDQISNKAFSLSQS